jgi:AcrR family transcriptional regulator
VTQRKTGQKAPPRRRGRPARSAAGSVPISRDAIVERALELSRTEALAEISMVRVARDLEVAPALIHYYLGSRDQLTSAIINRSYERIVAALPKPTSDWHSDATRVARVAYEHFKRYTGVPGYLVAHNKFRVIQLVGPGEADFGLAFFDAVATVFRRAGLSPPQAAMAVHLYLQHLLSSAYAAAARQLPGDHHGYLATAFERLSPRAFPGVQFVKSTFANLGADNAFDEGLALILDGFSGWIAARRGRAAGA